MTYFWETVDTIAPGLGWPHFGPFHLAVLAVFLLLGAVLCRGYCGMDTDKRRRWRRTVALLLVADELFKDFGLLYGGNFSLDYLPLHLCSINIFLIVLHAWRRPKLLDTFLYFVCLPAACAALLFPTWAPLPPLNFMVIHSFTVHFLLALYPLARRHGPAAARVPALLCPARGDGRADLVFQPCVRHELHVPHARRRGQPAQAL